MNIASHIRRHAGGMVSLAFGCAVFATCLWPLRALMNYHEQSHLFRWDAFYACEQLSTAAGWWEYVVSFVVQFFYVGWLGALIVALLAVGMQRLVWWLMKKTRLGRWYHYPLSLVVPGLLFAFGFVPSHYRNDHRFREIVAYDYLVRTHSWDAIIARAQRQSPVTECGVWSANYAYAMRGELLKHLADFSQYGTNGLLCDAPQQEPLAIYSMSDIYFQLGCINEAERLAFNAKQYLPRNHKSGRLYRRLAEANLLNGNRRVAEKYLHFLEHTLYYGQWARQCLQMNGNEKAIRRHYGWLLDRRQQRDNRLLSHVKAVMLAELYKENPNNAMALQYLAAFRLLQFVQLNSQQPLPVN